MSMGCLIRPAMIDKWAISYYMANGVWRWQRWCIMLVVETNAEQMPRSRKRSLVGLGHGGCWRAGSTDVKSIRSMGMRNRRFLDLD